MKTTLLALLLCFFSFALFAQGEESLPPTKSIYVELGGAGLPYSFNYDFRFDQTKVDSWGMRVGFGGYAMDGDSFFSLPVQVNKLMGKGPHYFEIGVGATFFAFSEDNDTYCIDGYFDEDSGQYICNSYESYGYNFILDVDGSPSLMGTLNFGYRRVPTDGGFTWKININPIFNNNGFWPLYGGVGFGYAF
ncbi:hypothetical protein PBT90_10480 [Algoriphagus halophytocola]|uniref:Outer membrane protein beta-barrel domain-containing protein n=1 Tax=Algoriphagus halophytocola TaxID=2991499 RepID=A0ABY6MNN4_9BACT|nr:MULTISPECIES: hypothetical protein [unclassified Algoriphagus]UZD23814.1 hypothetical protein OM944_04810 [Algoriphagus sp. TR-M5]WBL41181.1 hypothetical protein PBT90_10480 [Algoriphagus sp. TR-M9]